jgi:hypothetical protein
VRALAFALPLVLLGCSPPGERGNHAADERDSPAPSAQASAAPSAAAASPPGSKLPAADAERRYVGRWAARADLCTGGAWVFTRDGFAMEDGPACTFTNVRAEPGGYAIDAQCESGGSTSKSAVTLRFAESARAMLVEGLATLPDTGLVYCGPL